MLEVKNLKISFQETLVVRDITFSLQEGESLALVGESGCGKSMTLLSLTRLHPTNHATINGTITFQNKPLTAPIPEIAYIFQDPMQALNPVKKIKSQLCESLTLANRPKEDAISLLQSVDLPQTILNSYPCELSGGMCQRVMIAMALATNPKLLIADEPTTALDVTTQNEILNLIFHLIHTHKMSLLLSTHNLALVKRFDRLAVLYAGEIVEIGPASTLLHTPQHPYTQALLRAVPKISLGKDQPLYDIPGSVPSPIPTSGCAFAPRCPRYTPTLCSHYDSLISPLKCCHP